MLDEIMAVIWEQIEDEINGYMDEYVSNYSHDKYAGELRQKIRFEIAHVLSKHGVLKTD